MTSKDTVKAKQGSKAVKAPLGDEPRTRLKLNDRQVALVMKDIIEFGYTNLTFKEVREIADKVSAGKHSMGDPVARLIAIQIDEAVAMVAKGSR